MNLRDHKPEFERAVAYMRQELAHLRTGRAHPAFVDGVIVSAYDAMMPLKNVASISLSDSATIQIEPWDTSLLKAVEKGIHEANLGLQPVIDGVVLRLTMPKLTEETRAALVKVVQKKLEEARVVVRGTREKIRNDILHAEKEKKISEDERFRLQEELEKMTKQFVEEIERMGEDKEKDIMTV